MMEWGEKEEKKEEIIENFSNTIFDSKTGWLKKKNKKGSIITAPPCKCKNRINEEICG